MKVKGRDLIVGDSIMWGAPPNIYTIEEIKRCRTSRFSTQIMAKFAGEPGIQVLRSHIEYERGVGGGSHG